MRRYRRKVFWELRLTAAIFSREADISTGGPEKNAGTIV